MFIKNKIFIPPGKVTGEDMHLHQKQRIHTFNENKIKRYGYIAE